MKKTFKPNKTKVVAASSWGELQQLDKQELEDHMQHLLVALKNVADEAEEQISVADIDEFSYRISRVGEYVNDIEDALHVWYNNF